MISNAVFDRIQKFLKHESSGGILLFAAAVLAMICANTSLSRYYDLLCSIPVEVRIGGFEIAKPLLLWINDGLMAIFFFVIGLELKREIIEGELSDKRNIILPGIGAVGGMLVPALIFVFFNRGGPTPLRGWAVPAATDIAFALGVLTLLGSRVPISLKVFLTSLAIFDDVGAILIIAVFYTSKISMFALLGVVCCLPCLWLLNRLKVCAKAPYLFFGVLMWVAMLKSGVHATLAGVVAAMFIPLRVDSCRDVSPLKTLEHDLHSLVAYMVLPLFAFVNAGLDLRGMGAAQIFHNVPIGIALGLFVGKQIGVFGFCALVLKAGWVSFPQGMNYKNLYGIAALCGIGFTMSLFISGLAFEHNGAFIKFDERLGIILGSLASGVLGYFVLKRVLPEEAA